MYNISIYTDGACSPNPGQGGWACLLEAEGRPTKTSYGYYPKETRLSPSCAKILKSAKKKKPYYKEDLPFIETTNNRMELVAIIEGLKMLKKPNKSTIFLFSDSKWALNVLDGSWNAKENLDLVMYGKYLISKCNAVNFKWIKGHEGNINNEYVDELAVKAIQEKPRTFIINEVEIDWNK